MLRLVSIVGIAIAMVIGFVALSSKMKDDYTVRSHVVDILKQMTVLAADELQCESSNNAVPEVQIPKDPELTPLINSSAENTEDPAPDDQAATEDSKNAMNSETANHSNTTDSAQAEEQSTSDTYSETSAVEQNSSFVKTMGYKMLDSGDIEVVTIFDDIAGESGKTLVKSGSRVVISCTCSSQALSCTTVESNINKNYLPKSLTKQ